MHIFISDSGNIRLEKGFLTEQEKEYAVSMSQKPGNQYLGGRWLVRKALTFLLGGNDSMWVFDPKHPFLKLQNRPDPYISMSHSGSFIGSSICLHPCGLDLQVHVDKNILGIAETFFCESEY